LHCSFSQTPVAAAFPPSGDPRSNAGDAVGSHGGVGGPGIGPASRSSALVEVPEKNSADPLFFRLNGALLLSEHLGIGWQLVEDDR
jgi:hypothetical protein